MMPPKIFRAGHRSLNRLVLVFGDVPFLGASLWWLFGEWQRLAGPGNNSEP